MVTPCREVNGGSTSSPEFGWRYGYWFSWGLIVVTTIAQLLYYRRKRWI